MALDLAGLMTVIGEHVKKVNTFEALITSLETYKDDIYTDLAAEGLQDQYVNLPAQFLAMKSAVSGWISTLISDVTAVLQDPDYVLDELPIYNYDVTSVLNGLYDYMDDNSETIKSSVVTIAGADANKGHGQSPAVGDAQGSTTNLVGCETFVYPTLFCYRLLDGVNSPGNNVTAHSRYLGVESQLARSGTIYAELIDNSTIGSESAQIYSELPVQTPYGTSPESPGKGSILTNVEASNKLTTNTKFTTWSGDSPTGWSMTGTITTDYEDASGGGSGPLRINTAGVTATQQLTGMVHNTSYFMGVHFRTSDTSAGDDVVGIRIKNLAGTSVVAQITGALDTGNDLYAGMVYGFFQLADTVDLTDLYFEIDYETKNGLHIDVYKAIVGPVTYYNGLGWVWTVPYHTEANKTFTAIGSIATVAIANNNAGKGQTFFRKAYNIQLPTADSPTQADSLFGG